MKYLTRIFMTAKVIVLVLYFFILYVAFGFRYFRYLALYCQDVLNWTDQQQANIVSWKWANTCCMLSSRCLFCSSLTSICLSIAQIETTYIRDLFSRQCENSSLQLNLHVRPPPISDRQSKTPKFSRSKPYRWNI